MCVSVRCQGAPCSGAARTTNQIGFTKRNRNAKSVDAEGLRIALRRTPWVGLICERTWLGFCERSAMVPRTLLLATRGHCCLATKDGGDKLAYRRLGVWFARQMRLCLRAVRIDQLPSCLPMCYLAAFGLLQASVSVTASK